MFLSELLAAGWQILASFDKVLKTKNPANIDLQGF